MLKYLLSALFILIYLFSGQCIANSTQRFVLDFGTPEKYVESLNNIRENLGTAMPNVGYLNARIFELEPQRSGKQQGIIIAMRGLDYYGDEALAPISLVLDPTNLYIAGFIVHQENKDGYYRFSDMARITIPELEIHHLNDLSSYTHLERVAGIKTRQGMKINRATLMDGYSSLAQLTGNNLNQYSAKGLVRYITVISEALRFRQIQRNFRLALDAEKMVEYIMEAPDLDLTLNWAGLSAALLYVNDNNPNIQVGPIYLNGMVAILRTIAVSLNCSNKARSSDEIIECSANDAVAINNTI